MPRDGTSARAAVHRIKGAHGYRRRANRHAHHIPGWLAPTVLPSPGLHADVREVG
jgi:hypothetical protein